MGEYDIDELKIIFFALAVEQKQMYRSIGRDEVLARVGQIRETQKQAEPALLQQKQFMWSILQFLKENAPMKVTPTFNILHNQTQASMLYLIDEAMRKLEQEKKEMIACLTLMTF